MDKMTKTPTNKDLFGFFDDVVDEINGKAPKVHTHNYAGSSEPGGVANSAHKLTVTVGDKNHPVYFEGGEAKQCEAIGITVRSWT